MTTLDSNIMGYMDYETFIRIIAEIPSCIFFKDTDLKYQFSSHCWNQLISEDIVGKTDYDIRKDKENAIKAMEADREIIRSKKGCKYVIKSDIDGDISYLELIKEPVLTDDGQVIGIVGLINDITEKTIMEKKIVDMSEMLEVQCRELETSNDELKGTLEKYEKMHDSQKLFTASMNHELRSPLNGIMGSLELIKDDDNLTESQRESISSAYQSSQLMLEIVNELLDFAKFEMNGFTFYKEPFSLSRIIESVEASSIALAEKKNLEFKAIKEDGMPDIFVGDENKIKQVMINFISNAIKYTESGSVTLSVAYENDLLTISCADTGQGIAEESMSSLFDPYVRFQEKKNVKIQGTGLGLSAVKKIVDGMNGEIQVVSKLDVGSTFIVKIPISVPEGNITIDDSNKRDEEKTAASNIDFEKISALCIDDSKINATVMTRILKKLGMQADMANSAKEGISKADINKYDIIFMDHLMPEMDGIEAYGIIRKCSVKNQNTPVVMLTGNADPSYVELYRKHGFEGHLVKPVLTDAIVDMIASVLGKQK